MQLGSVRLSTGSEGDGKRVDNVLIEHDGSTHYRQVIVLGGPSTSAAGLDIIEPATAAPSSDVYALPVRLAANSTGNLIGAVAVSNSLAFSSGSVAPTSQWTVTAALAAGSTASVAPTSQWTVTAALAAGSTASVAPTSQWTVTAALAAGSTVSVSGSSVVVAPTSQWTVTAALAAGSTASVAPTSQWTVTAALAAASTLSANLISSTGAAVATSTAFADGMAILARLAASSSGQMVGQVALAAASTLSVAPTSQWTVTAALAAGSTVSVSPTSQWTVTAALAAASTLSVAPTSQWTVTAALAAGSTVSVSGSSVTVAPTSQWTVTAALAAGSTVSVSGSSVTVAPTSQWTVTAALAAGSTASVAPTSQWTIALAAASTLSVAPTSQWDVRVVGAGSSGVAGTNLISTGLTGEAIDPRMVTLQASSTSILIGVVALSSAQAGVRDPLYSTGVLGGRQVNFFSTGFAMGATQAMIALNHVTDGVVTSSSIASYTVTAAKNLILDYMIVSHINTTTAAKVANVIIHMATGGTASTASPRMFVVAVASNPGVGVANAGQTIPIDLNMVYPAAYGFGISGVATSSGNSVAIQICGREITQVL